MAVVLQTNLELEATPVDPKHLVNVQYVTDALAGIGAGGGGALPKFSVDIIGDGEKTEFEIEHGLGTQDVMVCVRNIINGSVVMTDVSVTGDDTVEVGFSDPPLAGDPKYRVTVIG